MSQRTVTITGGSGFIGQILRIGLRRRGFHVDVFDRFRGPLTNLLERRYLGTFHSEPMLTVARGIGFAQRRMQSKLIEKGVIKPGADDVLDLRTHLADRFRGGFAVVHLGGIPHPGWPGATAEDYRRINYDGSVNVFEAARQAGVPKFIFASSGQVYGINDPTKIDQFPILESNYCPTLEDGQSVYGVLKLDVENYLGAAAAHGGTQAIALRLECPGIRSTTPRNFYVSTSLENLVHGFVCALEARDDFAFDAFNIADPVVDPRIVDVQKFIRSTWPDVPNYTRGNECLLSTSRARDRIGYRPTDRGKHLHASVAFRHARAKARSYTN